MKTHPAAPRRASTGWRHYWFATVLLCVVTLLFSLSVRALFRRTERLTLPDSIGLSGAGVYEPSGGMGAVTALGVTPETVRSVVATLSRSTRYRRTITVRRTWSGGERDSVSTVTVCGPWTRVDRETPSGDTRHAVTDGVVTYIWYDSDGKLIKLPAGGVSADDEQRIPTYEDVLKLPVERIALADYNRIESGVECVYVETTQENAYKQRYWIGVETGLLVGAETLLNGNSIYWMEASEPEAPSPDAFTLPDGTVLRADY